MENTMRGNDMQNRCGLNDTQELRSPPEVDCQQPESPQGGPRHLGEACGHEPGRVPGGAVTARRWPAPRHPAGPLHAFGPVSALAFEQDSCPCSPLCSGFPLPVPLQLRRSWRCGQAGILSPPGLGVGDSFRLLFVTSTGRNASSSNIADYSRFVQGRAAAGHSAVRSFSSKFRVLASTHSVDARDHTGTRYTSTNKGVPIYWLDGDKVADDYEDFYDGSWDNKSRKGKNESGNAFSNSSWIWSGTRNDGTESPNALGVNRVTRIRLSSGATLWADDGSAFLNSNSWSLFSLSPVITLVDEVAVLGVSISSTPANATSGYAEGETIQVRIDFGESVSVTGTPYLVLNIAGRRAARPTRPARARAI